MCRGCEGIHVQDSGVCHCVVFGVELILRVELGDFAPMFVGAG